VLKNNYIAINYKTNKTKLNLLWKNCIINFTQLRFFCTKRCLGVVKDNTGNLLPVNIIEKGTQNGVSTDSDGSYKIKVKEGATLVFSYVGFSKLEKLLLLQWWMLVYLKKADKT
jgi:iron complex outermembrane receptor protein